MNITWDHIYLAMQIVITVQLLLGIVLNFIERKPRNFFLGYLCFLIIYSYNAFLLYPSFSPIVRKVLHIVGSYIYFGPVLYLYLRSLLIPNHRLKKEVAKHLVLPFFACLLYNFFLFRLYPVFIYTFLAFYAIASIALFKKVNALLYGAMKKRFLWFIGMTYTYLILDTPMLILEDLATFQVPPFEEGFGKINSFFYTYLHFPLLFLHFFILSLYAITEIPRFKKFFSSKSLEELGISRNHAGHLKEELNKLFERDKVYRNPELSLSLLAKQMNLDKSLVSKLVREVHNKGFHEFVNQYRIQDFKRLVVDENYKHYDLVSLAKESGFTSKATFFRVFKEMEEMTPNEYKNSLKP